uniref:Uncharacterized protein n=1 Tax=Salix viminalis TaxID=40686 RepID=A0A6N2LW82_SALVM
MPTQILLPAPNGISSKFCPLYSMFDPRNLSGLKEMGSSQESGSLPIAHTFTKTCVSLGIRYPMKFVSSKVFRGSSKGTTGCSLSVSLITACKYGRRNNAADMKRPNPAIWSLFMTSQPLSSRT